MLKSITWTETLVVAGVIAIVWLAYFPPSKHGSKQLPPKPAEPCKVFLPKGAKLVNPYTGGCKNGLAEGQGHAVLRRISKHDKKTHTVTFDGRFKDGLLTGKGTEWDFDGATHSWFEGTFKKWRRWDGTLRSGTTYATAIEQLKYAHGKETVVAEAVQPSEPTPSSTDSASSVSSTSQGEIAGLLADEQSAPAASPAPVAAPENSNAAVATEQPPASVEDKPSVLGSIFKAFGTALNRQIEEGVKDGIHRKVDEKLARAGISPPPIAPATRVRVRSLGFDGQDVQRASDQNACQIATVHPGSLAGSLGLQRGDVILWCITQNLFQGCAEIDALIKQWEEGRQRTGLQVWDTQSRLRNIPLSDSQLQMAKERAISSDQGGQSRTSPRVIWR
jgi:hypothetical protein